MSEQKTKHTPGPWRTGGTGGLIVFAADGYAVANATVFHQKQEEGESQANARLIAAAPALLAACKAALAYVRPAATGCECGFCQAKEQMQQAVAQAEGADQ